MSYILTNIPIDVVKSNVGGVKSIFVMPFQNLSGSVQVSGSSVTAIPIQSGSGNYFAQYNFRKQTGTAKDELKISDENASVYTDQEVNVEFTRVEAVKQAQLSMTATSDLLIIVLDNLGQYKLYGAANGMVPVTFEADSGKKYGDGSKYKLSFKGVEYAYAPFVSSGMITTLTTPA